jgi:uncharacterized protein YjbI with pentapeptide repeats
LSAWADREFVGLDFRDEDLSRLRTEPVVFSDCDFSGVSLADSEHVASAFRNCRFERTTLCHSAFRQCSMLGSVFTQCRLRPATFDEVDLRGATIDPSLWTTASLTGARVDVAQALAYAVAQGLDVHGH